MCGEGADRLGISEAGWGPAQTFVRCIPSTSAPGFPINTLQDPQGSHAKPSDVVVAEHNLIHG